MEIFFNMYKVKYTKLLELLRENPDINVGSNDTICVYINLESILLRMCNPNTIQYITVSKKSNVEFISNIINLAAHYKLFFTKHKLNCKIFLCLPTIKGLYKNSIHNKDYRMYNRFKFSETAGNSSLYKLIKDTIQFTQLFTEYIKDVYFIESEQIENSLVPFIIDKESDIDTKNFIVTGDPYDLQYVNYDFNIIIPKGDNSYVCTKHNTMNYLKEVYECKGEYSISSNFIPFILSIVGNKYRNIYSVKGLGMKTVFKTIQKALDKKLVSNNIDNIHLLLNIIKPNVRETVLNNYKCIDLNFQYSQLSKKDIYDIMSQVKDKFDNIALKKINDKYFNEYPIMLQEITSTPNNNAIKF